MPRWEKILVFRSEKDTNGVGRHRFIRRKLTPYAVLQCEDLNKVAAPIIDAGTPIPLHKSVQFRERQKERKPAADTKGKQRRRDVQQLFWGYYMRIIVLTG